MFYVPLKAIPKALFFVYYRRHNVTNYSILDHYKVNHQDMEESRSEVSVRVTRLTVSVLPGYSLRYFIN